MSSCFFALEGIDGSGKTSHAAELGRWLAQCGYAAVTCADPGGTPVGEAVRQVLLHGEARPCPFAELFLFSAARAQLTRDVIRPALLRGDVVISDRFHLSTLVYQGEHCGLDVTTNLAVLASDGIFPSRTILLDIPAEVALSRIAGRAPDRFESSRLSRLDELRRRYLSISTADRTVEIVNAAADFAEVQFQLQRLISARLIAAGKVSSTVA